MGGTCLESPVSLASPEHWVKSLNSHNAPMKCGRALFPLIDEESEAPRSKSHAMVVGRKLSGPRVAVWLQSLLPEPLHHVAWIRGRCLDGREGHLGPPWVRQDSVFQSLYISFLLGEVCNLRKPPPPPCLLEFPGEPDDCPSIPELSFLGLADPGRPTAPPIPSLSKQIPGPSACSCSTRGVRLSSQETAEIIHPRVSFS